MSWDLRSDGALPGSTRIEYSRPSPHPSRLHMNVFELTRALVDIESITENEERMGSALFAHLSELAANHGGQGERMPVEANRFNVLAGWGVPEGTFSTHMDTLPPFCAWREDG